MLSRDSYRVTHLAQNLSLVLLSIIFLPVDTLIGVLYYFHFLGLGHTNNITRPPKNAAESKNVLVTGVGMAKGLILARAFSQAGHRVIGADFEPFGILSSGRVSKSLSNFYRLSKPNAKNGASDYIAQLLNIIDDDKIDLWVSCSGVASAVEDGEAMEAIERETKCKCIQFDIETTQMLHEKHSFIERVSQLGLNIPETQVVTCRDAAKDVLDKANGKQFIMKTIGMDDSARGDIMTILPKKTSIETAKYLQKLNISDNNPWIVQQYIIGSEFCTHALVIRGEVRVFVACPSAELLMHYEALPPNSALNEAMLNFTKTFAKESGSDFTGHLSFDFLIDDADRDCSKADDITLFPIECNPRAHTAVVLFRHNQNMADAYLSLLDDGQTSTIPYNQRSDAIVTPQNPQLYHWHGHDLITCIVAPILGFFRGNSTLHDIMYGVALFIDYTLHWYDGTFVAWDPWPWWFLYHVHWPMQFLVAALTGTKWSRVNVSTTKIFVC